MGLRKQQLLPLMEKWILFSYCCCNQQNSAASPELCFQTLHTAECRERLLPWNTGNGTSHGLVPAHRRGGLIVCFNYPKASLLGGK